MTSYYAMTCIYQHDTEFRCSWNLTATKANPTAEEAIDHLEAIFHENVSDTWNLDDDISSQATLNLHGLSPEDFARELVLNEKQSKIRYGVDWVIQTNWEEVDLDNWDHPCNI